MIVTHHSGLINGRPCDTVGRFLISRSFRDGVIVGFSTTASGSRAFVWDAAHGLRTAAEILTAAGVTTADGWTLTEATGISADGQVIIGNGTNPSGWSEGWVARIP